MFDPSNLDARQISRCMPSRNTIVRMIKTFSVDVILLLRQFLNSADAVSMTCDKGNKGGIHHLVKLYACYDFGDKRVICGTLDIDSTSDSSNDHAQAIAHSMDMILQNCIAGFTSQTTDAGGGGVGPSLQRALRMKGLINEELYDFIMGFCSLHDLQSVIRNSIEDTFGTGGLDHYNVIQMAHSCWDMQEAYTSRAAFKEVFVKVAKEMEIIAPDEKIQNISKLVFTRWWRVTSACKHVLYFWPVWVHMANSCMGTHGKSLKLGKIARGLLILMSQKSMLADLSFIVAFSDTWVNKHMKFMQGTCPHAQDYGFLARFMPVHVFRMRQELLHFKDGGWKNHPKFQLFQHLASLVGEYSVSIPGQNNSTQAKMYNGNEIAQAFFNKAVTQFEKSFGHWVQQNLELTFAEDQALATIFARWARGDPIDGNAVVNKADTFHGEDIRVKDFVAFLDSDFCMTRAKLSEKKVVIRHQAAIMDIASGKDMWSHSLTYEDERDLAYLRDNWAKPYVLPVFSTTHRTEKTVGDIKNTATINSTESTRSCIAIARQWLLGSVHQELKRLAAVQQRNNQQSLPEGGNNSNTNDDDDDNWGGEEEAEREDDEDSDDDYDITCNVVIQDNFARNIEIDSVIDSMEIPDEVDPLEVEAQIGNCLQTYRASTDKPFLKWHKKRRVRGAKRNEALMNVIIEMDSEVERMLEDDGELALAREDLIEYFTTGGGKFQGLLFLVCNYLL